MTKNWDQDLREAQEALQGWKHPALADDLLICECYCVSLGEIRAFIKESGSADIENLQQRFQLGTGCGSCLKRREYWEPALKADPA